jgi:hypothetical protein
MNGSVTFDFQSHGHGCFGTDFGAACESGPDWTNALAEDEATITININIANLDVVSPPAGMSASKCPRYTRTATIKNSSRVKASDIDHDDDFAFFDFKGYGGGGSTNGGATEPVHSQLDHVAYTKHTMGPCTDNFLLRPCHTVYVGIVSLNHGAPLGGQAKNYAGMSRDHSRHAGAGKDPWDMHFNFGLTGSGSSVELGKGGDEPAVSVGTGIAYYHRRGRFTETPNLFNPYWRATLIGALRGSNDLGGLPGTAGVAWGALKGAGYRGEN